jgi:spoIIIJ-associated protein
VSDVREQPIGQDDTESLAAPVDDQMLGERSSQETRVRSADTRGAGAEPRAEAGPEQADGTDESGDDDENTLEGEAEIAADYLEELLDIADLDGDIDTYIEGDRAHVSIVSESRVLVGDRGEVLDALQELTRLAVMTETGERSRLMLDVAGFRERRCKQLVTAATSAVELARSTNEAVPLDPMNPFERKIVHDTVAAAGLSSASEGDEPQRHVVVHPQA